MTPDEHNAEIAHCTFKLAVWICLLGACIGAWVLLVVAVMEVWT